jgi:aminoglycoside 3-N-acetyltransferase
MALTREAIIEGLRALGVREGMVVMAHVGLASFGEIEGGADTLIEALKEAVGEAGTLCMPAMAQEQPFNVASSPSTVGSVTERFRTWPGVKRGLHPTHSACCLGPHADELIEGHINQPTALGPASPWGRIARLPHGYILLLGCDQDRNTLLHCAEEAVDAPYLQTIQRDYLDEDGQRRTKVLPRFPGPHRDFIGLDSLFAEGGAMKVGKIGRATCRLMNAGRTLDLAIAALRRDPAAVLCDNPSCEDCVRQRADIIRRRLASEEFTLAAVVDDIGLPLWEIGRAIRVVQGQGVDALEFGETLSTALIELPAPQIPGIARQIHEAGAQVAGVSYPGGHNLRDSVHRAADLAHVLGARHVKLPRLTWGDTEAEQALAMLATLSEELSEQGLTLLAENHADSRFGTRAACEEVLAAAPALRLAFNPAGFAQAGEKPFLQTFYRGKLKRLIAQLYVTDGCRPPDEPFTLPGQGHGEVKELISILRCRGFDGVLCLKLGDQRGKHEYVRHAKAFWHLMETM